MIIYVLDTRGLASTIITRLENSLTNVYQNPKPKTPQRTNRAMQASHSYFILLLLRNVFVCATRRYHLYSLLVVVSSIPSVGYTFSLRGQRF